MQASELPIEPLRRLTHGLFYGPAEADDVLQEAWLAALQRPGEIRGIEGWMMGAVRRLTRNRWRAEGRRQEHERRAARPEAEPSAAEASGRIEVLRNLLEAVDRLDEPYRTAIVLRFFDDLPPRAIAERLQLPVNTVRSRVRRGLEQLRHELDPGPGREREALLAAIVPLLRPGPGGLGHVHAKGEGAGLGARVKALVLEHPLTGALALTVLGAVTWLAWPAPRGEGAPGALQVAALGAGPGQDARAGASAPAPADPASGATASAGAGGRVALTGDGWIVRGRVVQQDGPLAQASLLGRVYAGPEATGTPLVEQRFTADAAGVFAWALAAPTALQTVEVRVDQVGFAAPAASSWFLPGDPPPRWQVWTFALDCTVHGVVRAPDGTPVAGARVSTSPTSPRAATSAADGSYSLTLASTLRPGVLGAWLAGFAPARAELGMLAPAADLERDLILAAELHLHGRVLDADGAPVAGAAVQVDTTMPDTGSGTLLPGPWAATVTDADGRYEIGGIRAGTNVVLAASATGHRPTEQMFPRVASWLERDCDIRLERAAAVSGVVTTGGAPVADAHVFLGDYPGDPDGVRAWSDADGHFTLTGAPTGPQHLWAWRRGHAQLVQDVHVQPGMPALALSLSAGHHLGGRVLDAEGAPVAWAFLRLENAEIEGLNLTGFETCTLADGSFRFDDLTGHGVRVVVVVRGYEQLVQTVTALDRDDLVLELTPETEEARSARTRQRDEDPDGGGMMLVRVGGSKTDAIAPDADTVDVLTPAGRGKLEGRLLDLEGNARAGAAIRLTPVRTALTGLERRATTDASGTFRFEGLPAGTFDVRWELEHGALHACGLQRRVTLAEGAYKMFELQPRGRSTLRGTLEFLQEWPKGGPGTQTKTAGYGTPPVLGDATGGMPPVVELRIVPSPGSADRGWNLRGGFVLDGRFELEGLEPGSYEVTALPTFPGEGGRSHVSRTQHTVRVPKDGVVELALTVVRPQ